MEIGKDEMQLLLDFIDIESSKYITATENKQYWNGTINGLEIARGIVKEFFVERLKKDETN
jgi:hypothetical protein